MHSEESNMTLWLTLGKMSPFEILYCYGHMTSKKSEISFTSVLCFRSIPDDISHVLVALSAYYT